MAGQDNREPIDPVDQLLEWHLNLMDGESSAQFETQLRENSQLQKKSELLGRVLSPLDHWSVVPAPSNLAENVLDAVSRSGRAERQPASGRPNFSFPFFRIRDFVAAAACVGLLMGVFVPAASALRGRSQRILCSGNMHTIAQGLNQYQASFAGALPFAGVAPDSTWLPGEDPTCFSSNSRHVFLLIKNGFVNKPNAFLCPSKKNAAPMNVAGLQGCDDFGDENNISYDSHNLAGTNPNLRPTTSLAYLADPNPLFIGARFNREVDPQQANSPAHGGCGQTVLFLDGRAEYVRTPILGANKDNMWTIEGVRQYTGRETPTRPYDSFLVPGIPKIHR